MKLTSNAKAQRPWWVVPVMLIGAACVLPGAALSIAGDQAPPYPPKDLTWQVQQASANEPAPRPGTPIPTSTPQFVKTYDAKPAIEKIKQEDACTDAQADAILSSSLANVSRHLPHVAPTGVIVDGDRVIVRGDDSSHNRVKRELERIEKYGFTDQVTMDAKFVSMASDKFSKLPLDWALIPQDTGSTPVLMVLLSPAELRSLVEQVQGDARSNLLHSPRVTLFNGQEGNIADMTQRPFVVGLQNPANESPEAEIRIEKSGVELTLCPEMDERFIDLNVRCYRSVIENVSTFSFQSGGKTCGVQVPKVVRQQFLTKTDLPHGHSLAYAMPDLSDPEIVSLVILTATPVSMIEQQANTDASASAISPGVNSDITFFQAQPYATVPAVAEVNAESDAEDEPVLIKADGPRMSDEDTLKLTKAIRKFGWAPHFEGTFEFEISDEKVRIKGKNIALSEDNDDLLIASPSGEIVFNLPQKTMHFQADTVLDFAFDDSALKVQGKELSLSEDGLRITGSPLRFEMKEHGFRGVSESLSYGNDLQFTGNVRLQTGDTKLSADKVELFDGGESHVLHLLGNVSFNGTIPANGTVEQYSVNTKAVSMKYNLKTGEFDMP
ncbi:LptA/OstA family protein [Rubripirellula tenax]|nr:LptA/OstA family protein [Rubripirellula tenax]